MPSLWGGELGVIQMFGSLISFLGSLFGFGNQENQESQSCPELRFRVRE